MKGGAFIRGNGEALNLRDGSSEVLYRYARGGDEGEDAGEESVDL